MTVHPTPIIEVWQELNRSCSSWVQSSWIVRYISRVHGGPTAVPLPWWQCLLAPEPVHVDGSPAIDCSWVGKGNSSGTRLLQEFSMLSCPMVFKVFLKSNLRITSLCWRLSRICLAACMDGSFCSLWSAIAQLTWCQDCSHCAHDVATSRFSIKVVDSVSNCNGLTHHPFLKCHQGCIKKKGCTVLSCCGDNADQWCESSQQSRTTARSDALIMFLRCCCERLPGPPAESFRKDWTAVVITSRMRGVRQEPGWGGGSFELIYRGQPGSCRLW